MTPIIQQHVNTFPDKRVSKALNEILKRMTPDNVDAAITAKAGGGQSTATPLKPTCSFHIVTTCATAADSIKLPPAVVGENHFVKNSGAASMQIFGAGTDTIDSVATATGVPQNISEGVFYICMVAGNYVRIGGVQVSSTFTALITGAITGSDSSLDIIGQQAAQGGSATQAGGTSTTSGNAGGASSVVGGTPGATGVGGAAIVTGGIGGATSGTGGAALVTGGAGTNGNAVGGAATITAGAGQGTGAGAVASIVGGASGAGATGNGGAAQQTGGAALSTNGNGGAVGMTGGLGTGTGAGGAITITSGAAGATGVAGAVNIAVGGATAGNGSSVTVTGGNGAGGTNAGGNVNLVGGTAVSTGIPGEVQVNGNAALIPVLVAFSATDASRAVFICTRAMRLKACSSMFTTASTSGTWTVEKLTGTTAAGSGTALLTGTIALSGSANTVSTGTLIGTVASITFAAGDRVSIVVAGTMTNLVGAIATIMMTPV